MAEKDYPQAAESLPSPTHVPEDVEHAEEHDIERHETPSHRPSNASNRPQTSLYPVKSHVSAHDIPHIDNHFEAGDEIYNKFPHHRKVVIVIVLSISSFLAPMSSTSILAAIPQVADTYQTTSSIINISNALYQVGPSFLLGLQDVLT